MANLQRHYVNGYAISLAASSSASGTPIQMPRDGNDIAVERIAVTVLDATTGAVVDPAVTVQLTDQGGSNQTLFVQPQIARNLVGDGSLPWVLPVPWRLKGNATLACDLVNLTANARTVYVTIHGRRIRPHEKIDGED